MIAGDYETSTGRFLTLVEAWNGTSWTVVPSPNRLNADNILDGVSCVPAAGCIAAGHSHPFNGTVTKTLIESGTVSG